MSGSIANQYLMFEQKRLCGDGAYATWAEQLREGDQQVDGEDEEFAHGTNATMIASTRKTAQHTRIPSYCEFATGDTIPKFWHRTNGTLRKRGVGTSAEWMA